MTQMVVHDDRRPTRRPGPTSHPQHMLTGRKSDESAFNDRFTQLWRIFKKFLQSES
jgi:hypothetical protein